MLCVTSCLLLVILNNCANALKCGQSVVNGMGTNTLVDLVNNLASDFAFNRSSMNVQSKVIYKQSTFAEGRAVLFKVISEQPVFSTSVLEPPSLQDKLQHPDVKFFPVLAGAICIVFNIPGITKLILSVNVTALIFRGEISNWNDIRIRELNPNTNLPNAEIRPVARSDLGGETDAFTDGLAKADAQWRQMYGRFDDPQFVDGRCCNSTKWPAVNIFGNTITGVVGIILSIPYTIGFTAYPNAMRNNLSFASMINSAGTLTIPTMSSVQTAMDYFLTINGGYNYDLNNALDKNAYPLAAFVYFMVNMTTHGSVSCCQAREFIAFIDWLLFTVNDSVIADFGLVKLSPAVALEIQRSVLQAITCHNELMYIAYLDTFIIPSLHLETWVVLTIAIVSTVALSIVVALLFYMTYLRKQKQAQEMKWLIPTGAIRVKGNKDIAFLNTVDEDEPPLPGSSYKSSGNSSDNGTIYTNQADQFKHMLMLGTFMDVTVCMDRLDNLPHPNMWKRQTKKVLKKMSDEFIHRNILRLRGATVWDIFSFSVFESCNKGTLHYVLQTCKYNLTDTVKFNLAMDIIEGLKYLQSRNIVHGFINSLTCYVESSWTVKIAQWHRHTLYGAENPVALHSLTEFQPDKLMEMTDIVDLLFVDHETYPNFNMSSDIFSFGMVLMEIFTKKIPYNDEVEKGLTSYPQIFETKFIMKKYPTRPEFDPNLIPLKVQDIIKNALSPVKGRQNIRQIAATLKKAKPNEKGIVDAMMEIIESHAESLELKTVQLQEITQRMQELLHEVLPPQIADKLFQGEIIPPESFENATVCFADIVGFTVISAKSTPQEVMSFLNDVWTSFDSIIQKFDVYKVDTIGDAYMVCSGLPERNGTLHCKNIASLSLALVDECENFTIYHIPNEKVQIRIGINTGPVTAGIVGSKMPQYCVFGDAVNTAARMQTTSLPMKIQVSETSNQLLKKHYTQFEMQIRGEIDVKGKGLMNTYWLVKEHNARYSAFSNRI